MKRFKSVFNKNRDGGNSDGEAAAVAGGPSGPGAAPVPAPASSSGVMGGRGMGSRMGSFFRRDRSDDDNSEFDIPQGDSPEANAARGVKLFCESGSEGSETAQGDEIIHLPTIVEATESSPAAATVAAQRIRKFLSQSNSSRPNVQYKAVMLLRILSDNPGPTFTRNIDAKFVGTVRDVLRSSRDPSVQQILRETLSALYREKAYDGNLTLLFNMFQKEGGISRDQSYLYPEGAVRQSQSQQFLAAQGSQGRRGSGRQLPAPAELAGRIEEAKTTAKLLQQLVQSTPAAELKSNDLIAEFAERCQTAQRSVQGYIQSENPAPDDETMQTLIETSDMLSLAISKHSRALLQARRAGGSSPGLPQASTNGSGAASPPPPSLPTRPVAATTGLAGGVAAGMGAAGASNHIRDEEEDDDVATGGRANTYSPPPLPGSSNKPLPVPGNTYSPPPLPYTTRKPVGPPTVDSTAEDLYGMNINPSAGSGGPLNSNPMPGMVATATGPVSDPFADEHAMDHLDVGPPRTPTGVEHGDRPAIVPTGSSYVRKQDDAEHNLTMHGGVEPSPVSPDRYGFDGPSLRGAAPTGQGVSPVMEARKPTIPQ